MKQWDIYVCVKCRHHFKFRSERVHVVIREPFHFHLLWNIASELQFWNLKWFAIANRTRLYLMSRSSGQNCMWSWKCSQEGQDIAWSQSPLSKMEGNCGRKTGLDRIGKPSLAWLKELTILMIKLCVWQGEVYEDRRHQIQHQWSPVLQLGAHLQRGWSWRCDGRQNQGFQWRVACDESKLGPELGRYVWLEWPSPFIHGHRLRWHHSCCQQCCPSWLEVWPNIWGSQLLV